MNARQFLRARRWAGALPGARAAAARTVTAPLLDEAALRQLMRLRLESGRALTGWFAGEHEGQRKTQALEFEDYRGYVPGDDFRLIDWNAYGRLGELFAKTSRAEETLPVSLLIDCSRSMDWGTPAKLRYSRQVAAALGALALLHGDPVRVHALGDGMAVPGPPLYGPTDLPALTASLEALPVFAATDLARCASNFQQAAPPGGVVFVLSDLLAPMADVEMLGFLALPSTAVVVVHVYDPSEALPDLKGTVELRDRESGATAILSITPSVRQLYARRFQDRAAELQARLAVQSIRYVAAPTSVPAIDLVAGGLRAEGMLAQG